MSDAERAALDPSSEEYYLRVNGSKTQVAGWSTYTFLLWILKASMCTFYLRLTDGLNYRWRIYVGFGMIVTTWLAVLLSILLGCRPMSKNWQIYPDPGNFCQPAISRIDIFVTVVLNVVTDVYLLSIPLPMLWKANLPAAKKMGLMVLFSGGLFVTMAGILRCVLIITNPVTGAQQAGSWACRETFVAVVTSNLPMVFPLVRRWGGPFVRSLRDGVSLSRGSRAPGSGIKVGTGRSGQSGGGGAGVFVLEDKNPRRGMGPRSVNPLPNMTLSESEERIYDEERQQQRQEQEQQQKDVERQGKKNNRSQKQQGITKEVVLHITEEEQSRNAYYGSDASSVDMPEAIEGARRGNYFLTQQGGPTSPTSPTRIHRQQQQQQQQQQRHEALVSTSMSPSATAASPLAAPSWTGKPDNMGGSSTKPGNVRR
ncbi:hypothetical protein SPI_02352 [Niveomyces insectorum RCEF 264]|uniref:Rhodopsin domain-containing protein n=1 Tax=Niveomyces insectorum RCEF 264 TaxID=1081102 RepID=A0A167XY55_9HYPO|nr:hypothetical protein SPI_02352 [Niveomyces insectorum RCEF 264]